LVSGPFSGLAGTLVALVTDHVLHNEAKLPISIAIVAAPAFLIATVLAVRVLPGVRALRTKVVSLTGET
jgi:hypothetical protein